MEQSVAMASGLFRRLTAVYGRTKDSKPVSVPWASEPRIPRAHTRRKLLNFGGTEEPYQIAVVRLRWRNRADRERKWAEMAFRTGPCGSDNWPEKAKFRAVHAAPIDRRRMSLSARLAEGTPPGSNRLWVGCWRGSKCLRSPPLGERNSDRT